MVTEDEFRAEALAFLDANASPRRAVTNAWGEGSDDVALFAEKTVDQERSEVAAAVEWRRRIFDAGFGWPTGPAAYGGRELPSSFDRVWRQAEAAYEVPPPIPFGIGLGMVAPTILAHGSDVAKDQYLRAMYRGDVIGCQLFSEPVAGSDLAGLQTKAERDGDEWVINGQKVWTSGAQYSDIGEIICRTDPSLPKHKGLTGFVVDMHAPGVEVRPLRQMTGGAAFNEVFFTDVRVPDDRRLGDVNQGWTVALTTLMNERAALGGGVGSNGRMSSARLRQLVRHMGMDTDAVARQQLADIYINAQVSQFTSQRALDRVKAGGLPGPELSIGKLSLTRNMQRIERMLSHVLGVKLVADSREWGTYAWAQFVMGIPGMRVAGGTDEVMKNIIGERVLGLPKEPPPKG